jgi:gliding motility-associated lipoprotein GldD
MKNLTKISVILKLLPVILLLSLSLCRRHYTPKPSGYMRIDFPEKEYRLFDSTCPFIFEYPLYGRIVPDTERIAEPCWFNIEFPQFDGKIHMSYKPVRDNINEYIEDSRTLAYKHTIKADAIKETVFTNDSARVYGLLYEIKGDAASNVQFYLTDSNRHFLRGSLYFNVRPDADSMAPVINFFLEDIMHFIETCEWKYQ